MIEKSKRRALINIKRGKRVTPSFSDEGLRSGRGPIRILGLVYNIQTIRVVDLGFVALQVDPFWAIGFEVNYNNLTRPDPKWWFI